MDSSSSRSFDIDDVRNRELPPLTSRPKRDPNNDLKQLITKRLKSSGFYEELSVMAREAVLDLGMRPSSYREMCKLLIPKARLLVPPGVRKELESVVRASLKAKQ